MFVAVFRIADDVVSDQFCVAASCSTIYDAVAECDAGGSSSLKCGLSERKI
jgi:hypothetical protein